MCYKLSDYFPPIFILVLVLYSYYTYVVVFCIFFVTSWVKKAIYIFFYHLLVIMFLWCFFTTICMEHDSVPDEYRLSSQEHLKLIMNPQQEISSILQKIISLRRLEIYTCTDMGQIRYCKDCHLLKPDRTHHCSTCERCILKMDHHCPWVGNCVGYNNYKQFFLALLYAFLWTSFCTTTIGTHVLELWKDFSGNWQKILIGVGAGIFGMSALLVLSLFGYHAVLLCRNETTLEASREVCFRDEYLSFNIGCWNNFTQVFGNNICCWLLPTFTALGNGHEFPVARTE